MNQPRNSNGCAKQIVTTFFMLFFGVALIGSFFLMPVFQRLAVETVCHPGTIVYDKWTSHRKTPTCIDKKTGKKTDVAIYEIFGCCPLMFVLFGIVIYAIFANLVFRNSNTSDNDLKQNFRNFKMK